MLPALTEQNVDGVVFPAATHDGTRHAEVTGVADPAGSAARQHPE